MLYVLKIHCTSSKFLFLFLNMLLGYFIKLVIWENACFIKKNKRNHKANFSGTEVGEQGLFFFFLHLLLKFQFKTKLLMAVFSPENTKYGCTHHSQGILGCLMLECPCDSFSLTSIAHIFKSCQDLGKRYKQITIVVFVYAPEYKA